MNKANIVKEIDKLCKKYHLTIMTSESCNGGGILIIFLSLAN